MKRLLCISSLLMLLALSSCEKESADIVDVGVLIHVQDSKSNDLLSSAYPNSYSLEDIRFEYYHDEGVLFKSGQFEVNNPVIREDKKGYGIWLVPSTLKMVRISDSPWVKIHWPDGDIDKLDFEVYHSQNITSISKVYLNKTQVWPNNDSAGKQRFIMIVK